MIPNAVFLPLQLVFMVENVGIKWTVKLVQSCLICNIFLISDLPDYELNAQIVLIFDLIYCSE